MKPSRWRITETFTTRLLGSAPADKDVYRNYIADKKIETEEKRRRFANDRGMDEPVAVGTVEQEVDSIREESGGTTFHNNLGQNEENGDPGQGLHLLDYQIKGFFKEAAEVLQGEHGVKQPRSKLDNFLFVYPRCIYIRDGDRILTEPDGKLERPLLGRTMQGPRVSLACSEMINPGRTISYEVELLPYVKSGSGKEARSIDVDRFIEMLLEYGARKGRGQWRNGGNGRFRFEMKPTFPG